MGTRLSEHELQKSLDFCVNLFNPTSPEQHVRVAKSGLSHDFLDATAPVMDPTILELALQMGEISLGGAPGSVRNSSAGLPTISDSDSGCEIEDLQFLPPPIVKRPDRRPKRSDSDAEKMAETKMVLKKINARRIVHSEFTMNNLESEDLNGFVVRLEKGRLGLMKVRK